MARKIWIRKNEYFDSMVLMMVNHEISGLPGIRRAAILMATDNNKLLLRNYDIPEEEMEEAGPADLIVVLETVHPSETEDALSLIEKRLKEKGRMVKRGKRFASLESAYQKLNEANLALISIPGPFAAREARKALHRNMNVFLYSDNVPLQEEIRLKELAREKGLLLMGPDCGTALITGVGLGFANVVPGGPVGVVGASGSGIQEVCVLLNRFAHLGISHAIGVGGRDLSDQVQGISSFQALDLLNQDPRSECIILLSKPPSQEVSIRILKKIEEMSKPVVVCFLGRETTMFRNRVGAHVTMVNDLEGAVTATAEIMGRKISSGITEVYEETKSKALREAEKLRGGQRFLRGIYSGGTLCYESMAFLREHLSRIHSNLYLPGTIRLLESSKSFEHTLLDMGDDEFTRGRVHPMINPTVIAERIRSESDDPTVGIILFDLLLGNGGHPDPSSVLAPAVLQAKEGAEKRGRYLMVLSHVCGTDKDPQDLSRQEERLKQAGILILASNMQSTRIAADIIRKVAG
jgi:FdrA protein